jgi:hypothetical protein
MADEKQTQALDHVDERGIKLGDSDTSLRAVQDDPRVKRIKRKVDYRLSAILAVSN